jgi:hypothetical protein
MRVLLISFIFSLFIDFQYLQKVETNNYCWLNVRYVECLKNKLPCDCEKITEGYFSIVIDTSRSRRQYGIALSNFDQMEPYIYGIKKTAFNKFVLLKKNEDSLKSALITLKGDTLYYEENGQVGKFTKSKKSNEFDTEFYVKDNVELIDDALFKRGYPRLETILKEDSLNCACNKWIGKINLLSITGKSKSWTIEQVRDSLFISKIINAPDDPDDSIITKKIRSFKW